MNQLKRIADSKAPKTSETSPSLQTDKAIAENKNSNHSEVKLIVDKKSDEGV